MKNIIALLGIAVIISFTSCKKNLPDVGATAAKAVANEWWVTLMLNNVDLIGKHVKISTYNTSANNSDIWVDDLGNTWQFKVKAQVNYGSLTFKSTSAANEYYPITVDLMNGKVLIGQGKSKTGNVTDSIYMQARFSDDPANTYVISGHARTKFKEDEY